MVELKKQGILVERQPWLPEVRRLQTVSDWHTQIARIYRRAASGELPEHIATKLTYVAVEGATLAKIMQELKELELLRAKIDAIESGHLLLPQNHINGSQEYLPANTPGDQDL